MIAILSIFFSALLIIAPWILGLGGSVLMWVNTLIGLFFLITSVSRLIPSDHA
jgi:hypothetical protein